MLLKPNPDSPKPYWVMGLDTVGRQCQMTWTTLDFRPYMWLIEPSARPARYELFLKDLKVDGPKVGPLASGSLDEMELAAWEAIKALNHLTMIWL